MSVLQSMKAEFESIGSESGLAAFANKLGLIRMQGQGQFAIYSGSPWALAVEVRERWWDPSSVYTPQVDKHEAVLVVDDNQIATVRFIGSS